MKELFVALLTLFGFAVCTTAQVTFTTGPLSPQINVQSAPAGFSPSGWPVATGDGLTDDWQALQFLRAFNRVSSGIASTSFFNGHLIVTALSGSGFAYTPIGARFPTAPTGSIELNGQWCQIVSGTPSMTSITVSGCNDSVGLQAAVWYYVGSVVSIAGRTVTKVQGIDFGYYGDPSAYRVPYEAVPENAKFLNIDGTIYTLGTGNYVYVVNSPQTITLNAPPVGVKSDSNVMVYFGNPSFVPEGLENFQLKLLSYPTGKYLVTKSLTTYGVFKEDVGVGLTSSYLYVPPSSPAFSSGVPMPVIAETSLPSGENWHEIVTNLGVQIGTGNSDAINVLRHP